ncbi:hypothetical protein R3P38DRAFT_3306380 [Favolaschia claudopus]|uniref:CxC1-like cysteine cluster associated with KDZ transposases domain-containing protein n=1 Tax=Favolaschia claudopus TaxID=2862362 RepID=A0AAW0DKW6_9AGAR
MAKTKRGGLSGSHKVSYGRPGRSNPVKTVPVNQTGAQIRAARETHKQRLAALRTLPPGEEGYLHSHAGKEATFQQIFDKCKPGRGDPRRRANRVQIMIDSWRQQLPWLVDAYLELKDRGPLPHPGDNGWKIEVIGLDEYGLHSFLHAGDAHRTNETLIRHGFLGASPEKVSLAFPLKLFEVYRQIHRVCPRYSIGSLSTTLTNLHETPQRAALAEQLSAAYDAYLEILREVDARVHSALNRNADWYIKNLCAPCMYKTKNEPPLRFRWLNCMDGNNSLKLVDATFLSGHSRPNDRVSTSFRWLTPAQVDAYKDEVANSQKKSRSKSTTTPSVPVPEAPASSSQLPLPTQPEATSSSQETSETSHTPADINEDPDIAWLNVNELSGAEAEELTKCLDTCVERWKAAGPEARKKMFSLFAVSGIFVVVCRHGHVVVMCDMIRSGELMKYPLAMVKALMDRYGADIGVGYDIMCAFFKTLTRSSLGSQVTAMRLRGVVPAFHGHAHNRACQIGWHPLYVDGVGLEDFEECERTFSKSNHLAAATRLATPFHRQQQIDEHFHFHDLDKHAASGNFIYQNYRQALEKIVANNAQLKVLEASLGTTAADYENYYASEVQYFEGLRQEPEEVQRTVDYIEKLRKYSEAVTAADQAKVDFKRLDYNIVNNGYTKPQIAQVRTRYRTTFTKLLATEEDLCRFEESHNIEVRWTMGSKEYEEGYALANQRKYRAALTEVERLVVQRLFELTKLGMSGLAYNMREKISKALKTRSEAIRRALITYNEAAAQLTPPRERLSFADVIHTTTLAEFDILRDTRQDIRLLPWTQPARREATVLHFGIKRAKEEIRRLNVEIVRLLTFLVDEHAEYYRGIAANLITNPPLATELQRRWRHASKVSAAICKRIATTSRLVGFSGSIFPGVHEDSQVDGGEGIPAPYWLATELGEPPDGESGPNTAGDDSEVVVRELEVDEDHIVALMDHLSTFDDSQ